MRVLVTRAYNDAQRTALELAKRGHRALVAPLSEIRLIHNPEPDFDDVQALLATSSNGVRAFAHRCSKRDIPVFAVGENTAATARSAGFARVLNADGDSTALAAKIRKTLDPAAGALLHITGTRSAGELHRELSAAGFAYRVWELYDTIACNTLPEQAVTALRDGALDAVLVLSPDSGRDLATALKTARVEARCGQLVACCISKAAAAAIKDVDFGAIRVAEKPNLEAVLALLGSEPTHQGGAGLDVCGKA